MVNIFREKPKNKLHFYKVTTANKTIVGKKNMEFVHEKLIIFSLEEENSEELFFRYKLYNQEMKGSSILHKWTADMEHLHSDLLFIAKRNGELVDIKNFHTLYDKWTNQMISKLRQKYPKAFTDVMIPETSKLLQDKNRFLETFIGYSSWRFFFQDMYREYEEIESQNLLLKGYFGEIDLPLVLNKKVIPYETAVFVKRIEQKAELDEKAFERKKFSRMLKDITGIYDLNAQLLVDMEEIYCLDIEGNITSGDLFLETKVGNWYSVASAHQLIKISKEKLEKLSKDIEQREHALTNTPSRFYIDEKEQM